MKFDMSRIRRVISNCTKKPKRNVVYTIGYSKFSPKEIIRKTRMFISDDDNKKRVKKALRTTRDFICDKKHKERARNAYGSVKRFVNKRK